LGLLDRGLFAGAQDVLDPHPDVGLRVALEPAVVLATAELLDHRLLGRQVHHTGDDPRPLDPRRARERGRPVLVGPHLGQFELLAGLDVAVVQNDGAVRLDAVLAGAVLNDRVHVSTQAVNATHVRRLPLYGFGYPATSSNYRQTPRSRAAERSAETPR